MKSTAGVHAVKPRIAGAAVAALGIVFGDIGTSPLYAFRECFAGPHADAIPINPANLTGAASLILWSLLLVVSLKYLFMILRLDNKGEGGILALSALIRSGTRRLGGTDPKAVLLLGLAGAALIYADGMLTPSISVLSAVEGLTVSAPYLDGWIVPIAVALLAGLFTIQKHGTKLVGRIFGPVVLVWFVTLGLLGINQIIKQPHILTALNPYEGVSFLVREWRHSLPLLAAVFLAVTGGEALYADLGHFGKRPIRFGWFSVVLPGLALNYLGQAALLVGDPSAIRSPFFLMAPNLLRFPLTILATGAAIIASQALISGAFSLTAQAVQLGVLPRFRILHTSDESVGQVYVPAVNLFLAVTCIILVIEFGSSAALAGAYGIAIALTMTITSLLFYSAARSVWGWNTLKAGAVTCIFLSIDGAFLIANASKIIHGGWFPLVIAGSFMGLMLIWMRGRRLLWARIQRDSMPVEMLLHELKKGKIHRVSGTAIYMTGGGNIVPGAMLHNLKHNQVLHERLILLHVITLDEPHAMQANSLTHEENGEGLHRVVLRFGFADEPDVPNALKKHLPQAIRFQPGKATYFLGRETYAVGKKASLFDRIRLSIFATMARNASPATAYFKLPPGRVVELGAQLTL